MWLAVCGNPIQLSLFQEIEIRDLAYAGKRKLEALGVVATKRDAHIAQFRFYLLDQYQLAGVDMDAAALLGCKEAQLWSRFDMRYFMELDADTNL